MEKKRSQKFLKKRKLAVVLPLLTVPFVFILFWAVKSSDVMAQGKDEKAGKGLNTELPDAHLKGGQADKLSFYRQADNDSMALQEQMRNDPYYSNADTSPVTGGSLGGSLYPPGGLQVYTDPNEDRINQRLALLSGQINSPASSYGVAPYRNNLSASADISKLDAMMQAMGNGGAEDPEMRQLNSMLDKLLDLQNPGLAAERMKQLSLKNKKQAYVVTAVKSDKTIEAFGGNRQLQASKQSGFYEWNEKEGLQADEANTVEAVVAETRTLTAGSTIKLKLIDGMMVAGKIVPAGSFVYGYCMVSDDRLTVNITTVKTGKSLFTVSLAVYDNDGIRGIYVPGAITRDVAKNAASDAVQGVDLYTMDNSIGMQAATAGVKAAKTLISKKSKLIKLTVKNGYRIFLKNTNEQD